MLRPETLPRRRRRILLPALLAAAIGALLLEEGHPLPAATATVSRWALQDPSPALERLLGLTRSDLSSLGGLAAPTTVHLLAHGRHLILTIE